MIVALALALGWLTAPLAAGAPPAGKPPRIGVLTFAEAPSLAGLRQGLREVGLVAGRNAVVDVRLAGGRDDRYGPLARELVGLDVDVLVTIGSQAVRAAMDATSAIPIVMFAVSHPVEAGFVTSLARPGGNVTGMSSQLGDLAGKTVELMREAVPGLRRIAELWDPNNVASALGHRQTVEAAQQVGVHVVSVPVRRPEDLEAALPALGRDRPDAVFVHPAPAIMVRYEAVAEFALKHRLPTMSGPRSLAERGFLMSYGPSPFDMGRRAARYVDRILKGARPADLPIEQPTKFDLVVNLKTARALGLTLPPALVLRADHVVE